MCILGSYVTVTCSGVYRIHEVGVAQGFIINNAMQHTLTKRYAKSNATLPRSPNFHWQFHNYAEAEPGGIQ